MDMKEIEVSYQDLSRIESIKNNDVIRIIFNYVSEFLDLEEDKFYIKKRTLKNVFARQLTFYFARKHTDYTLADIGSIFGVGHDNVIHSIKKIDGYVDVNKPTRKFIEKVNLNIKIYKVHKESRIFKLFTEILDKYVLDSEEKKYLIKKYYNTI